MANDNVKRRTLMKAAGVGGASLLILPSGVVSGKNAPSNKLNIALIGAHGRATAHYRGLAKENVVALCDINEATWPWRPSSSPTPSTMSIGASASSIRIRTPSSAVRWITPTPSSPCGQ